MKKTLLKRTLSLVSAAAMVGTGSSLAAIVDASAAEVTSVVIDSKTFPDWYFRDYIRECCDTDQNGTLSKDEINAVYSMDASNKSITSFAGINVFTNLKLFDGSDNNINSIDLSLPNVDEVILERTAIKDITLNTPKLNYLTIYASDLEKFDGAGAPNLKELNIQSNRELKYLDVSSNSKLEVLRCAYSTLEFLDVSNNPNLTYLDCSACNITKLDVGSAPLYYVNLWGNPLPAVDFSQCTGTLDMFSEYFTSVEAKENCIDGTINLAQFPELDPEKIKRVEGADLVDGKFVNVTDGTIYYYYDCTSLASGPIELGVSLRHDMKDHSSDSGKCPDCGGVEINEKNFPDEVFRDYVITAFDNDRNSTLDKDELLAAKEIDIYYNDALCSVKGIEFFPNLEMLSLCYCGKLESVDISKNTKLKTLSLSSSAIRSLDVTKNTALESLGLSRTNVKSIDLSKNLKLKSLYNEYGKIQKLDLRNNKALDWLDMTKSELSEIYLPKNKFDSIYLDDCKLASIDMTGVTCDDIFAASYNRASVTADPETWEIDLSKIPNFDVSKIDKTKGVSGAELKNGKFVNIEGDLIDYYYKMNDEYGAWFQMDVTKPARIKVQPKDVTVSKAGETAVFSVEAEGDQLSYKWYLKTPSTPTFNATKCDDPTYRIEVTEKLDNSELFCVITDKTGGTVQTKTVKLNIASAVKITAQPKSAVVFNAGDTAKATVTASGTGLTYTWYIKDPGASAYTKSSIKTNTYSVALTAAKSGRQLYCVVADKFGNTAKTNVITFTLGNKVKITSNIKDITVSKAGDTARATVVATGDGLTYKWYMKAPGASTYGLTATTTATYATPVTAAKNGTHLFCMVYDKYGNKVQSNIITLSINTVKITSQPKNVTVAKAGDIAKVTVGATGEGLTYKWYMKTPGASSYGLTATTTATYATPVTAAKNGTRLFCMVYDKYGNKVQSDIVTLSIGTQKSTVKITSQPKSVTVAKAGDTAKVTVGATGDGLTYKWYMKTPNASTYGLTATTTATYATPVTAAKNGTRLFCMVYDKYGNKVQSNTVVLSIK